MPFALIPASVSDEPFLQDLFRQVRAPEFAALPEPARSQILDMQYRVRKMGYAAQFPSAEDSLITVDGISAGRLLLARSATEIHVVDIALLDSYRNFVTIQDPGFVLKLHKKEADLLRPYFEEQVKRSLEDYENKYKIKRLYSRICGQTFSRA